MTTQGQKAAKTHFLCRITNENYDFLYVVARRADVSLAAALNRILANERRKAVSEHCVNSKSILNIGAGNYAR